MDEDVRPASFEVEAERTRRARNARRVRVALGCLVALTFSCLGLCGLVGYGFHRHGKDVRRHGVAPMAEEANEADPNFRLLARVRSSLGTQALTTCTQLEDVLDGELDRLSDRDAFAFHEWTRARLAELDTQPMREACQVVGYGGCPEPVFLWFRAYLLAMGRPTFSLAVAADDEALARILPQAPYCQSFVDVTYAAAVRSVLHEDAGVDAGPRDLGPTDIGERDAGHDPALQGIADEPADAATPADAGLPLASRIEPPTSTRLLPRRELGATHPHLCHRFTCTLADVFD